MYTYDLFNDRIMRHNRCDKQPAKNPDVPRHEERVRQSGRSWEEGGARNVHPGATPDPRATAQSEHRPGPPQDSSDYLLQSSQFPPLRPVQNTSARQPDQDPADSGHTGLATAQGSWRTGHEQQRDAVPAAGEKVNDTPHCTRRQSETGIATADRLTEGRGQRDSIEATPDRQSSAVSANYTNNSEMNDSSVTDEQRGSASVYNLRVRDNSQADTDASQRDTTAESGNRVTRRTAVAARAIRDSVKMARGFGRGRGKISPSQGCVDKMFHTQRSANEESNATAQSNKTGVVDGSDANDTDALFDDAADSLEYDRPRFIRSVSFLLYNVAGIPSKFSDSDWVKYIEQSDFVTLVKTFVDNT